MISAEQQQAPNILFLHPEEPTKSFLFPFNKELSNTQTLKDFFTTVSDEKKFYFKFNDVFSRPVPEHKTVEDFRALQPFYITQMIPKITKILISLPKGDTLPFEMDIGDKPTKIMEFLEKELNYPQEQQKLYFADRLVFPNSTLMSQGFNTSTIELTLALKTKVNVECVEGNFVIYAEANELMSRLKELIQVKIQVPQEQQILVSIEDGKEIRNTEDLLGIGIYNEGTIKLELKTKTIFLLPNEKTLMEFLTPTTKVSELKAKFKGMITPLNLALQPEQYDFEIIHENNNVLLQDEEKTFKDYKIGKEVQLKTKLRPGIICVYLVQNAKSYYVCADRSQTIADVKKIVSETWRLDENKIKLLLNGAELPVETLLNTLEIQPDNTTKVDFESNTVYNLFVVTLTGKKLEVTFDVTNSVEAFKKEIEKQEGIPPDQQRLIYAGKQMEDNKSILDYNVPNGETIHLVLRLRGGGGGPPGFPFADITQAGLAQDIDWADEEDLVPEWRYVRASGLCLEGRCTNFAGCEAFGNYVIVSKGIGTYDVLLDEHTNKCPMCNQYVQAKKVAFNNCTYSYTGIMLGEDGEPPKKVTCQKEMTVGDHYKLFDPRKVGTKKWQSLKIVTKSRMNPYDYFDGLNGIVAQKQEINEGDSCGICKKKVEGEPCVLECAHIYHKECVEQIKELGVKCAFCHL